MTAAEALPYHLCLKLGLPHPDYLDEVLTAGQYLDWQRYAGQFGISPDRDDVYWGVHLSMYANAHLKEGYSPRAPAEFMFYNAPEEEVDADLLRFRIKSQLVRVRVASGKE